MRASRPSRCEQVLDHAEGLVCLTGCAEHGIEDEPTAQTTARRVLARSACGSSCSAPTLAATSSATAPGSASPAGSLVPTVATGDVHAHTRERALLQHAFVAIKHGLTLDGSEVQRRPNDTHVLATPQGMAQRLSDYPDAVAESVRLAETLTF